PLDGRRYWARAGRDHRLVETQVSTVYRHGVRFGKAGLAEVDVYPCSGDHLYGITGTAHGPDAADAFHNLGEIDLRGGGEPEAEISSPASLVGRASATDQRLAWCTAEVDAGPASQPLLVHGAVVAALCSRQCGDQPGWATAYDYKVVVAAKRILPVRRVTLVDRTLVVFIRWY